jgi:ubiquinone/menaquinone biosynthesis C-methylase UbiE
MTTKKTKSTIFHDKIATKYESAYKNPYWNLYSEITWHNLKKYLPKKKKAIILDAGGGTGLWSRKLAKLGFNVVCSDVAQKMLDVGMKSAKKEKLDKKIEFKYADITNMKDFKNNSFDMVIAQGDPVGYCGNPKKAIKELSRVAKRGVHISVSIDSFYSVLGRLLFNKDFKQIDKLLKTHITEFRGKYPQYNFTIDELKKMFESAGLKVIDVIGKPIFTRFIPREKLNKMLLNKKFFNKMLEIENRFNNEPSIVGLSGHIQIIGKKL